MMCRNQKPYQREKNVQGKVRKENGGPARWKHQVIACAFKGNGSIFTRHGYKREHWARSSLSSHAGKPPSSPWEEYPTPTAWKWVSFLWEGCWSYLALSHFIPRQSRRLKQKIRQQEILSPNSASRRWQLHQNFWGRSYFQMRLFFTYREEWINIKTRFDP